jgi:hypothetical protein
MSWHYTMLHHIVKITANLNKEDFFFPAQVGTHTYASRAMENGLTFCDIGLKQKDGSTRFTVWLNCTDVTTLTSIFVISVPHRKSW